MNGRKGENKLAHSKFSNIWQKCQHKCHLKILIQTVLTDFIFPVPPHWPLGQIEIVLSTQGPAVSTVKIFASRDIFRTCSFFAPFFFSRSGCSQSSSQKPGKLPLDCSHKAHLTSVCSCSSTATKHFPPLCPQGNLWGITGLPLGPQLAGLRKPNPLDSLYLK